MRIAFCCDVGRAEGLGHLMRCLALAEEVAGRGATPLFVAALGGHGWARDRVTARGYRWVPPGDDPAVTLLALDAAAVVLDSYLLPASVPARLRAAGLPVLAVVDGDTRGQPADIYLDQNLGAESDPALAADAAPGAVLLAGLRYALHRTDVLAHRPAAPRRERHAEPSVLAFFGGTDPYGAAPVLATALAATGAPCRATVVAASAELAAAVSAVPVAPDQRRRIVGPTDQLPRLVAACDVVVAAAGTSAWELACLGAAAALVCVTGNQETGYARAVATGAVAGLGRLADLRADPTRAVPPLRSLLTDPATRNTLRAAAWHLVDGAGRHRVADQLLNLAARTPATNADPAIPDQR